MTPRTNVHVVLNWFEELKQRVPSERRASIGSIRVARRAGTAQANSAR